MNDSVIAILLGRKDSKGIRDKNIMPILGKPAFMYPLIAAENSKYITDIFLSTDHQDIINKVKESDVNLVNRPDYLCTDEALFEDALIHAYNQAVKLLSSKPKYVVVLMCNAVTVNSDIIDMYRKR